MTVEQTLPQKIQAQVEQAEALRKQVYETPAPEGNTEETPAVAETAAPAEAEVEVREVTPPEPVQAADEGYRQRFEVLQGKYNAEVPRLHQANRELQQQLQLISARLEEVRKEPEPAPRETAVTEKDVETFGEDMVDFVRRVFQNEIRSTLPPMVQQLRAELQPKLAQVDHVMQRQMETEVDRFWAEVRQSVPDWDTVDQDPRWIAFLETSPPGSLKTYRDLAGEAVEACKVAPVAALVNSWKAQAGLLASESKSAERTRELERQVAPSTTKTSSAPPGERMWTRAEYERAYDPRTAREMRPDQLVQLQEEADRAVAEGRVRW